MAWARKRTRAGRRCSTSVSALSLSVSRIEKVFDALIWMPPVMCMGLDGALVAAQVQRDGGVVDAGFLPDRLAPRQRRPYRGRGAGRRRNARTSRRLVSANASQKRTLSLWRWAGFDLKALRGGLLRGCRPVSVGCHGLRGGVLSVCSRGRAQRSRVERGHRCAAPAPVRRHSAAQSDAGAVRRQP